MPRNARAQALRTPPIRMSRTPQSKPPSGGEPLPADGGALRSRPLAQLAQLAAGLPSLPDAEKQAQPSPARAASTPWARALRGKLVIARDARGRGGKTVTCVRGIEAAPALLEALAKELRHELGTGVRVEQGVLIVQGALSVRVAACLEQRGAARIVLGN